MADYIGLGVETDPETIAEDFDAYVQSYFPEFVAAAGSLIAILRDAQSQNTAILNELANRHGEEIFRYIGPLFAIFPYNPVAASAETTWTMVDSSSYEIPAGTELDGTAADGSTIGFSTLTTTTISGGSGTITVQAVEAGTDANDVTGALVQVNAINGVDTVTLDAATSGGDEGETDEEYIDRLSDILQLQSPAPILPDDFATFIRTQVPGIYRAVSIDMYDPDTMLYDQERFVSTAAIDIDGEDISAPLQAEALELLNDAREATFEARIISPTYTTIDVWFTATSLTGYEDSEVQARAVSAVETLLSPATWGVIPGGDPQSWINQTDVRRYEIITAVNNVEGIDYVDELWIAESGDAAGLVDLTLTGVAPLTRAGTVLSEAP